MTAVSKFITSTENL